MYQGNRMGWMSIKRQSNNRDGWTSDRISKKTKGKGQAPAVTLSAGFKAEDDGAVHRIDDRRGGDPGRDFDQCIDRSGRVGDQRAYRGLHDAARQLVVPAQNGGPCPGRPVHPVAAVQTVAAECAGLRRRLRHDHRYKLLHCRLDYRLSIGLIV